MKSPESYSSEEEILPQNPEAQKVELASDRELALILAQEIDGLLGPTGMSLEEHSKKMKFCVERAEALLANAKFTDSYSRKIVQEALDRARQTH